MGGPVSRSRKLEKPKWLRDFRKRIALIEVFELVFEIDCDCEVCQRLRTIAHEMGEEFLSGSRTVRLGGES